MDNETLHASALDFARYAKQTALKGAPLSLATPSKADSLASPRQKGKGRGKKRIAYVITVTKDGRCLDGALVLGRPPRRAHAQTLSSPLDGVGAGHQ